MSRRFEHLGRTWDVWATGTGHGVGSGGVGGVLPKIDRWGMIIRPNPPDGSEYRVWISSPDPQQAAEAELKEALDEQRVVASINESRYVWRPAEAISKDVNLEVERVREILHDSTEVISSGLNQQGLLLYTTGEHLSRTSGDVMQQVFEVEESS